MLVEPNFKKITNISRMFEHAANKSCNLLPEMPEQKVCLSYEAISLLTQLTLLYGLRTQEVMALRNS